MGNTCISKAYKNCRLPEKDNYFYFHPCNANRRWIPIPGPAVRVPPTGLPVLIQFPLVGGVATVPGTEFEPTDPEVVESMEPYASLFPGPVPASCLPPVTNSGPSGAASSPMGGGSTASVPPDDPMGGGSTIRYVGLPREPGGYSSTEADALSNMQFRRTVNPQKDDRGIPIWIDNESLPVVMRGDSKKLAWKTALERSVSYALLNCDPQRRVPLGVINQDSSIEQLIAAYRDMWVEMKLSQRPYLRPELWLKMCEGTDTEPTPSGSSSAPAALKSTNDNALLQCVDPVTLMASVPAPSAPTSTDALRSRKTVMVYDSSILSCSTKKAKSPFIGMKENWEYSGHVFPWTNVTDLGEGGMTVHGMVAALLQQRGGRTEKFGSDIDCHVVICYNGLAGEVSHGEKNPIWFEGAPESQRSPARRQVSMRSSWSLGFTMPPPLSVALAARSGKPKLSFALLTTR